MNLSSHIIRVRDEHAATLMEKLNAGQLCECHLYENGKLVVTIEGNDTGEEMEKVRLIKLNPEVITIDLIYAYSENELEQARDFIEKNNSIPEWLNSNDIDAKQIKYSGNQFQ